MRQYTVTVIQQVVQEYTLDIEARSQLEANAIAEKRHEEGVDGWKTDGGHCPSSHVTGVAWDGGCDCGSRICHVCSPRG